LAGELEVLGGLPQYHFVHYKSHVTLPRIERGASRCSPCKTQIGGKTFDFIPRIRLVLTTLLRKRNLRSLSRPLLVAEYRTTMKYVRPVKPVSTESAFRVFKPPPPQCAYRYSPGCYRGSFSYGDALHKLRKINQNRWSQFLEYHHFMFWGPSEAPLFLEIKCLYSPHTDRE
jgi:hypothetical protein